MRVTAAARGRGMIATRCQARAPQRGHPPGVGSATGRGGSGGWGAGFEGGPDPGDPFLAAAVGQEAVVADFDQALGEDVEGEAADELAQPGAIYRHQQGASLGVATPDGEEPFQLGPTEDLRAAGLRPHPRQETFQLVGRALTVWLSELGERCRPSRR